MEELPRCRAATWADVDRWADRLEELVRSAGPVPETLVGLTRGGWVPARLLADRLGVHRVVSLRAQHWGVTATPSGAAVVSEGLSGPVKGQRTLVVDDITDTGDSLRLAVDHVKRAGPSSVESAAFLHIGHSKFVPTYYAEEIPRGSWVWVVFPWNYWEDLATLAARASEISPDLQGIRATLKEKANLEVPIEDLERLARYRQVRPG